MIARAHTALPNLAVATPNAFPNQPLPGLPQHRQPFHPSPEITAALPPGLSCGPIHRGSG